MLHNNSQKPLYLQLEADLKQAIKSKKYLPGDRLPSEDELCRQYDVSRITVRRAIQELTNQNLLEKHRGKGTFVTQPVRSVPIGCQNGFTSYITNSGHTSRHLILIKKLRPVDDMLRQKFHTEKEEPFYYVKRIIFEDDTPLALDEIYLPTASYPGFLDYMTNETSFYQILDQIYHVSRGESSCKLSVTIADTAYASVLQCQTGDPLFILNKMCYDIAGLPVHYSRSVVRGDRTTYTIHTTSASTAMTAHIHSDN